METNKEIIEKLSMDIANYNCLNVGIITASIDICVYDLQRNFELYGTNAKIFEKLTKACKNDKLIDTSAIILTAFVNKENSNIITITATGFNY